MGVQVENLDWTQLGLGGCYREYTSYQAYNPDESGEGPDPKTEDDRM